MATVLIIGILVFAVLGVPIGFSLGIASMFALLHDGSIPLIVIPQKIFNGIDSFPILAIPFFILAGNIMTAGGLNKKIIEFANSLVGWISGSLAMVTVFSSMFFAAISGSAVATVTAVGGTTIPGMKKEGYPAPFAGVLAASAAVCGPIIPPSIPLIVYGAALGMSISDLFIGALVPGLILGLVLCVLSYVISKKNNYPKHGKASLPEIIKKGKTGFWALAMPVIILGGIFGGVFTPTEASVIAVVYTLIVGFFIYKDLKISHLSGILLDSAIGTSVIMIILAISKITGWIIVASHLPEIVANSILGLTSSKVLIVLMVNLILLLVGCLMEANAAIVILTPVLVPLMASIGMSPLQFGIVMTFNLCLGLLTPPVGATILIGNDIANERMERTVVAGVPFFIAGLSVLMLISFIPELTTSLPALLSK